MKILPGLFAAIRVALPSQLALPFQHRRGIESLHHNFNNLNLVSLSEGTIVKKIAEFRFVVDGVASRLKFLAVIQRLQDARPLPIRNIVVFSIGI